MRGIARPGLRSPGRRARIASLAVGACLAVLVAPAGFGAVLTVNLSGDDSDGTCDAVTCTLREAIDASNLLAGPDQIFFDLPLDGTTISLNGPLSALTDQVMIDGTTQPGYPSAKVVVDGSHALPDNNGIVVNSSGNVITGLVIAGFTNRNVWITQPGNTLSASFVGTDAAGTTTITPPAFGSVTVQGGGGNTIGGATAADGNVIAGGLTIFGSTGGATTVRNNRIGVDATGTMALAGAALRVDQAHTTSILDNVVASIDVQSASGTDIRRNRIGTNAAGTAALINAPSANGIQLLLAPDTTIGAAGEGNVVSGKAGDGIRIQDSTGVVVKGNRIGTSPDGLSAIPNSGDGILTTATDTPPSATIGGIASGEGNTIANNAGAGIAVFESAPTGIVIRGNAIYGNGGAEIDLGSDGPTANDAGDVDTGPNGLQNKPTVVTATQSGSGAGLLTLAISLSGKLGTVYSLDVYAGPGCGTRQWIGTTDIQTAPDDPNLIRVAGSGSYVPTLSLAYASAAGAPEFASATVTGPEGTSELSDCTAIAGSPPVADAFVVDSTDDFGDETTGDGICKTDVGSNCTLRAAIEEANATPNAGAPDRIEFAIPGSGPHLIDAGSNFPDTADVLVDGTTQPGYSGTPVIEVRGPGGSSQAFFGAGNNVTVKGLSITGWGTAVALLGSGGVEDSWLGVEPGGALRPNTDVGVVLEGTGASVVRSRIAGGQCGVLVTASTNSACGITPGDVQEGSGNTIGGSESAGNTIYGFASAGVHVSGAGTGNKIQGNAIGLDPSGSPSGSLNGVFVLDSPGTIVGADAGPPDLNNAAYPPFGNVVAGIGGDEGVYGILVAGASAGTRVTFNSVGTNRAGTATTIGIDGTGIGVLSSDVQIGPGNEVAHNNDTGVEVADANGDRIVANSIHDNGGLGISLVNANHALAAPTLTSVTVDGSLTTISGTVDVPESGSYFVEVFSNATCDDSGSGEGRTYLTFVTVVADAAGTLPFSTGLTGLPAGEVYAATLTGPTNDTSEFSNCLGPTSTAPPVVTGLTLSGPATADAGASLVPLAGIPPAALVTPQTSGTQAAPVNQSPVNQSPVNQLPVNQLPVNQSPVNQSPVNQLPVNQSPVNQSGLDFKSLALGPGPLGDTALSTIPLMRNGGWGALLAGTALAGTPLQSGTLRQVFGLSPLPPALRPGAANPILFADIDFSNSPLGSLPAMTLALGELPLSGIPLVPPTVTWCQLFSGPPLNCSGSLPANTSLLSAALEGAPVNQSPVNQSPVNQSLIDALAAAQAPVNQLPVNQLPVNQLPVNQLPVNQSRILSFPVNQLPVNQSPVNQSPVNQLSLNAILVANAPVNQSPVNQLPVNQLPVNQSVLDCGGIQCTGTLGQYVGKVLPGQTLGDLRRALPNDVPDDWTIANLEDFGNLIVGDLLRSLPQPNDLTLADVLALALFANDPESFAFETLNIFDTSLSLYASPPGAAPYSVDFTLAPNGGPTGVPATIAVSVTLPRTFAYAPGSSKLAQSPGTCSAGAPVDDPSLTQLAGNPGVTKATWSVTGNVGSSYTLCFSTRPGIVLGPQSASAAATPGGGATASADAPEPVTVVDGSEPSNNTPSSAPVLATSNLHLSYLTSATDVDYYRVAVPAVGSRTTFHLSHLPVDYDLVVYGPEQTPLRPPSASTPPLDGDPLVDTGSELTHRTDALPSQTLDDLRLQTFPLVGVSASRNTDPEDVTVLSDGIGSFYTVQVTSYNGATSADPYMLRVTTEEPRVPVSTPPRTVTGTTGSAAGALPAAFNTLFLVNRQRLEGLYGAAGATSVLGAITANQASFTALGFPNVMLSVDAYSAVRAAYSAWDASPGNPDLANKVVAAINAVVDSVRAQPNGAGLKYLVIVGGDRVIPQGRLGDFTTAANEIGYADTFDRSSDLYANLRAGQMLSDDPYGTLEPVPYLNRQLYVPRLSVGRLVETPADIAATLSRFTTFGGRLNPATSLVTGYDFMQDGATAINAPFASRFGGGAVTLPSPIATGSANWTRASLLGAFLPTGGSAPSITSLNGHADHFEFAPPSVAPPFFTTGDLPLGTAAAPAGGTGPLVNRLVFSMGCHAGLSVSDAVVTANTYDWPQAYAHNGVGAYLGNTGFGYGDSLVVAYSEQLDSIFAAKIAAGSTVGNALAAAKQEYFGSLGVFGVYDEKAMAEFTLYGLPMWSVNTPDGGAAPASVTLASGGPSGGVQVLSLQATAATPTSTSVVTDAATGLEAEAFVLDGITNAEHTTPLGRYWSGPDGVQATHFRPLQPKAFVEVTGTSGHGALITELRQQADTPNVDPVFARPIIDTQATEPELSFGDVAFPARLQALRTFQKDGTLVQRVVLMTGQFFTGTAPGDTGKGAQRLYTRIGARVLRSSSNDFAPPAFTRIDASKVEGTAAFSIDVTDTGGTATVKRVLVALRSGSDTTWKFSDLGRVGTTSTWSGGIPLTAAGDQFEYFVQAVDAAGNVAVSTNKGFFFAAAAPTEPTGGVTVAPVSPVPSSGWFTGQTGVVVNGPEGVTLQVSVDGGPFTAVPSGTGPAVSGDGIHVVDARGSNGGTATTLVPIDGSGPRITIGAPLNGAAYRRGSVLIADFACADAGSGVASCTGTVASGSPISTTTTGTRTFAVNATDNVGNPATLSVTYTVIEPCALPAPAGAIVRGGGNDTINGTAGNDVIYDSGGNNKIDGKGGNDTICTGSGNDTIVTGGGNDIVIDTGGNNTVDTGGGNDEISTRTGNDKITAGAGNDVVTDTGGNSTVDVGGGDDRVTTGTGNDKIDAAAGNDIVDDTSGNNTIDVAGGDDRVTTGTGNDVITAGDGNDTVNDGGGNNTVNVGGGIDNVTTGSGNDTIEGGAQDDTITAGNGNNTVKGSDGNDRITAGSGNDKIDGGPGYDVCKPGTGANTVTNCEA